MEILILGCGFTGEVVARRFLAKGARVLITTRDLRRAERLKGAELVALRDLSERLPPGVLVLHSIPPGGPPGLLDLLGDKPSRLVYLSSTAVYGTARVVDETTPVDLATERARARLEVERDVIDGPWSSLVLRPAAIYGPGRGVHERVKRGEAVVGDEIVSRIHVDDLATHVEAGLLSDVTGAYPVADEEPCTSREIAEFCAGLLGLPLPAMNVDHERSTRRNANRRVDGSSIRRALGISLRYPSYRDGIPAALREGAFS